MATGVQDQVVPTGAQVQEVQSEALAAAPVYQGAPVVYQEAQAPVAVLPEPQVHQGPVAAAQEVEEGK